MEADQIKYLESLADELVSQATRVRNLIGSAHWLSDGHHHEAVLLDVIRRHIGRNYIATRGFILDPACREHCSKEQDILIIDVSRQAPMFYQHDLVISKPDNVIAAISVKATLNKAQLIDAMYGLATAKQIVNGSIANDSKIWTGAFFFAVSETIENNSSKALEYIKDSFGKYPEKRITDMTPDLISTADKFAIGVRWNESHNTPTFYANEYKKLSSALMLSQLIDHTIHHAGGRSQLSDNISEIEAASIGNPLTIVTPPQT